MTPPKEILIRQGFLKKRTKKQKPLVLPMFWQYQGFIFNHLGRM